MALVRIPYFGLIFRPFVKQEISRDCLFGLLGKINPEKILMVNLWFLEP